ncbi:sporulation membrane protein YtaF [Fuchsiella alkaliacetigena]|uniref:sporulation membrane protein YtaF n=1 Tax=Fuchsiella alkaliacetigena TaxID=957042 RepID=UPI00200B03BD|nr:sporulation membrane protein YtaF [Fuchsiella alkaliacetigena]MCK8824015.1 sporulation membrane protein YtaF [Fuchsiella alkaliacetigena]
MGTFSMVILALAVSLDGSLAGITYGLRKVKIPKLSLLIISLTSATAVLISMVLGQFIAQFLSPDFAELIGGLMLVLIGSWIFYQSLRQLMWQRSLDSEIEIDNNLSERELLFKLNIKSLGLAIKILQEPMQADLDHSGVISKAEAVFLGFALALDALGAGFGAAMAGYSPLITTIFVGVSKFVCISLGLYLGSKFNLGENNYKATLLPGLLLILLGLFNIFT